MFNVARKRVVQQGILSLGLLFATGSVFAVDSLYCPQNHGYINVGMSAADVMSKCGPPNAKQMGKNTIKRKVPVKQMIYSSINKGSKFSGWDKIYNTWNLPSNTSGINFTVNIMDGKISSMSLNGSPINASSICFQENMTFDESEPSQGQSIQIGDPASAVTSACGTPSLMNETYITQAIPESQHPEKWIYHDELSQTSFSLIFLNGTLESIESPSD